MKEGFGSFHFFLSLEVVALNLYPVVVLARLFLFINVDQHKGSMNRSQTEQLDNVRQTILQSFACLFL